MSKHQEISINNLEHYKTLQDAVCNNLDALSSFCNEINFNEAVEKLSILSQKLQNYSFKVGIMGEFKRGKSTLINALLGEQIIPAQIVPTSATLNYVKYAEKPYAVINYLDGKTEEIKISSLEKYITKITKSSAKKAAKIKYSEVYYPSEFCKDGVEIIDTPGLNDDKSMTDIAQNVIPSLDSIVIVITPDSPLSETEASFIRNKIVTSDLSRIMFVLNKTDGLSLDEVKLLTKEIRKRVKENVLNKIEKVYLQEYDKNSDKYKEIIADVKEKLNNIKILPISAKNALKGKQTNDIDLIKQSGFFDFERELFKVLTKERGALQLITPIHALFSVIDTASLYIEKRLNALNLEDKEFTENYDNAVNSFTKKQREEKDKIDLLKQNYLRSKKEILNISSFKYDEIHEEMFSFLHNYYFTVSDFEEDDGLSRFEKKLKEKWEEVLSFAFESIVVKIQQSLNTEQLNIKKIKEDYSNTIQSILNTFNTNCSTEENTLKWDGITGSVSGIFDIIGIGGAITGWKELGLKGAIYGGLSGSGLALLTATLLPTIAIAPIVSGLIGVFGTKQILKTFFKHDIAVKNFEKNKTNLIQQVETLISERIQELSNNRTFENFTEEKVSFAYENLIKNIDDEFNEMNLNVNKTLSQMLKDRKNPTEEINSLNRQLEKLREFRYNVVGIKDKIALT